MKKSKHIGAYGLILDKDKIILINKVGGPYNGKLDLPGGTIEFGEKPEDALVRELEEEVGIKVTDFTLFDGNSIYKEWSYKDYEEQLHHLGFFYKINKYENEIQSNISITEVNDDSLGAQFYNINELSKDNLSDIAILEIEKLGYKLK